jgi:hypothetical protein
MCIVVVERFRKIPGMQATLAVVQRRCCEAQAAQNSLKKITFTTNTLIDLVFPNRRC